MEELRLSVLVIEDDETLRETLEEALSYEGYNVTSLAKGEDGLSLLEKTHFDIVLCDLKLPGINGMEFIDLSRELNTEPTIILMTAYGDKKTAINALRRGAYDYLAKPFDIDELILTLKKVEEREKLRAENRTLKGLSHSQGKFSNIIGESKPMQDIFEKVRRIAPFKTTILITGESGTGKELLANAIHRNSPRAGKPMVTVNCGAIPENLIESELFGHKMGAFTDAIRDRKGLLEEANGGTVFLDEIGELPLHLQVKLLRVLQESKLRRVGEEQLREIDIRVLAATHKDLEKEVAAGRFREDLYYRLNVVQICIPALRNRPEDIPALVRHFIKKYNRKLGTKIRDISPEVKKCFMKYPWKGNIRELENCIERGIILANSDVIDLDAIPEKISAYHSGSRAIETSLGRDIGDKDSLSIKERVRELETNLILKALERTGGNRTHAAKLLEISHRTLLYKLKEYGLTEAYRVRRSKN
ncbi:MAG: sigma-54-dependent Fis family transcriptional regulator [Candidatus Dadabacteria bacterium]|nr:MAG: sigma-54-dependent Fis family transcriptional regulator [Candidatus Dadabacteria bacterium]